MQAVRSSTSVQYRSRRGSQHSNDHRDEQVFERHSPLCVRVRLIFVVPACLRSRPSGRVNRLRGPGLRSTPLWHSVISGPGARLVSLSTCPPLTGPPSVSSIIHSSLCCFSLLISVDVAVDLSTIELFFVALGRSDCCSTLNRCRCRLVHHQVGGLSFFACSIGSNSVSLLTCPPSSWFLCRSLYPSHLFRIEDCFCHQVRLLLKSVSLLTCPPPNLGCVFLGASTISWRVFHVVWYLFCLFDTLLFPIVVSGQRSHLVQGNASLLEAVCA